MGSSFVGYRVSIQCCGKGDKVRWTGVVWKKSGAGNGGIAPQMSLSPRLEPDANEEGTQDDSALMARRQEAGFSGLATLGRGNDKDFRVVGSSMDRLGSQNPHPAAKDAARVGHAGIRPARCDIQ